MLVRKAERSNGIFRTVLGERLYGMLADGPRMGASCIPNGRSIGWRRAVRKRTRSLRTAPYTSYRTFNTFIEDLREHGVPSRIDRSVLPRFSGVVGGQLMHALRFLGLIDDEGRHDRASQKARDRPRRSGMARGVVTGP